MRKNFAYLVAVAAILAIALFSFLQPGESVTAAPVAAPTPVSGATTKIDIQPRTIIYKDPGTVTSDTRFCPSQPTGAYGLMDLEYVLDQPATPNTVTVKIQYTNRQQRFVDGVTIVNAGTTDTNNLNQFHMFGQYTCILVDVGNAQPLSVTLIAVAK